MNTECFLIFQRIGGEKPLLTTETVVNLIANTRTETGLKNKGEHLIITITIKESKLAPRKWKKINLLTDEFHPEWNYQIIPC